MMHPLEKKTVALGRSIRTNPLDLLMFAVPNDQGKRRV
jgi:hypothetical protein